MTEEDFDELVSELRFGNLLYVEEEGIGTVKRIGRLNLDLDCQSGCMGDFEHLDFDPIPINKEMLIKIGFEHKFQLNKNLITKDGFTILEYDDRAWVVSFEITDVSENGTDLLGRKTQVVFLHQLQNFFFWSTTKELEIDIDSIFGDDYYQ